MDINDFNIFCLSYIFYNENVNDLLIILIIKFKNDVKFWSFYYGKISGINFYNKGKDYTIICLDYSELFMLI